MPQSNSKIPIKRQHFTFYLQASRNWMQWLSLLHLLWLSCMLWAVVLQFNRYNCWLSTLFIAIVFLFAFYWWLMELSAYQHKVAATQLHLVTTSRSGWRYSSFQVYFWHPALVIIYDYNSHAYLPILPASLRQMDGYYRLLQLTWRIKNAYLLPLV